MGHEWPLHVHRGRQQLGHCTEDLVTRAMRQVAVIAVVGVAVVMTATTYLRSTRDRAEILEQSRVQHEEMTRRLARLEQLLALASDRNVPAPAVLQGSSPAHGDSSKNEVAKPEAAAANLPEHA